MPCQHGPPAVYDAVCHALAIAARSDLRSLLTSTSHVFRAAALGLSDDHAIALCCALLASHGAPSSLLRRFLSAYAQFRPQHTLPPQPVALYPIKHPRTAQLCTLDFSENPLLSGHAAAAILAACLVMPRVMFVELDLHDCTAVSTISLTRWTHFVSAHKRNNHPSAQLCGLQLDGCPLRIIDLDTLVLLRDVRWISLRYTALRNLWRCKEIFQALSNLTAALVTGTSSPVQDQYQLDHVKNFCRRGLLSSSAQTAFATSTFNASLLCTSPTPRSMFNQHSLPDILQSIDLRKPAHLTQADSIDHSTELALSANQATLLSNSDSPSPDTLNENSPLGTNANLDSRQIEDIQAFLRAPHNVQGNVDLSRMEDIHAYFRRMRRVPVARSQQFSDFILANTSESLKLLDGVTISPTQRKEAIQKLGEYYEEFAEPHHRPPHMSINAMLRNRELGLSAPFHSPSKTNHLPAEARQKKRRRTTDYSPRVTDIMAAVAAAGFPSVRRHSRLSPSTSLTVALAAASSAHANRDSLGASTERIHKAALIPPPEIDEIASTSRQSTAQLGTNHRRRRRTMRARLHSYAEGDFALSMSTALIRRHGAPHIQYLDQGQDRPRQFEYNPARPAELVYGTDNGYIVVIDQETGEVKGSCLSGGGRGNRPAGQKIPQTTSLADTGVVRNILDENEASVHSAPVYGLSWLNKRSDMFLSGSNDGSIHVYNVNWMKSGERGGCMYACETFDRLTSLHVSCDDARFAVSGFQENVGLYDLQTGQRIELMRECHTQAINVIKFAHGCPHVLVTSSFDRYVKKWDLRESRPGGGRRPIFKARSRTDNVMACFSPDDTRLLVSAEDNEVRQYLACDGTLEREFNIPKTRSTLNFTRSYYMNDRDYIITGSSKEDVVRIYNARTGAIFTEVDMDNREVLTGRRLCIQTLRANPHRSFNFSVLLASNTEATTYGLIANADLYRR